jgi:putative glutathione S-transferase
MSEGTYVEPSFERDTTYITDRITVDGAGDGSGDGAWPIEAGRYRLVVSRACPWANRATIVRRLLGLEDAISMGICGPTHDADSWTFDLDPGGVDPVLGIPRIKDAYDKRFPGYPRGITVPAIVDVSRGVVVTNDFAQLTLDLSTQWRDHHREGAPDLYPHDLRAEIDEVNRWVYTEVNNGVYRCGFAGTQAAYDAAYDRLFSALDRLEARLLNQRYLVGDTITEADVRLFTTLARFDAVYHGHFKCNRSKLSEMPVLWAYARDLFTTPGFGTPPTSCTSRATTTRSTATSIPPASCRPGRTCRAGRSRTLGKRSVGDRSVTAPHPGPPPAGERVPTVHNPHVGDDGLVRA